MGMKISEMITDRYKLRIPPTVYYDLLADVQELEEEEEPTTKNDLGVDCISREDALMCLTGEFEDKQYEPSELVSIFSKRIKHLPSATPQEPRWIPVSERLPKESDGKVLITVNGKVGTGQYSEYSNRWYKGDM